MTIYKIKHHKGAAPNYRRWTFPAGELGVELLEEPSSVVNVITADIGNAEGLFEILLLADAIKHATPDSAQLELVIPYIPFGRQDRHTTPNSPFSLRVVADVLNTIGFSKVSTYTPHSNVSELLINNLNVVEHMQNPHPKVPLKDLVIIAPDAGAEKRCYHYAKLWGVPRVIVCSKRRDPQTGTITGFECPDKWETNQSNKHFIVVDDICDGGMTFIKLAEIMPKTRGSLTLQVCHGIFSKGRQILLDAGYDHVYSQFNFLEKPQ